MQLSDFERFRSLMAGMASVYSRDLDTPLLDAYWIALKDWELQDFETVLGHLIGSCKFMPRPSEFNEIGRAGQITPYEAWVHVLSGAILVPETIEAKAAEAVGGQNFIRMANIETTLPHIQRRFLDAYQEIGEATTARKVSVLRLGSEDSKAALARISARMEPETVGLLRQDR